jgi:broad specificity phosphatase PhoE
MRDRALASRSGGSLLDVSSCSTALFLRCHVRIECKARTGLWRFRREGITVGRMRRILLARHGETASNVAGRLQGHTDISLNEVGRGQARALAARLAGAGLTAIWTSDLARARETGEIIAAELGRAAPTIDPELRERHYGIFEGLTREECMARDLAAWTTWVRETGAPPGGEPGTDATARLARALRRIADGDGGPVLVVSHGAVMRLFLMSAIGAPVPIVANATTYIVEHDAAGIAIATLAQP